MGRKCLSLHQTDKDLIWLESREGKWECPGKKPAWHNTCMKRVCGRDITYSYPGCTCQILNASLVNKTVTSFVASSLVHFGIILLAA